MLREILAGELAEPARDRNRQILIVGNATFHTVAILRGRGRLWHADRHRGGDRPNIMLVGGRVVPSFTHNWITRVNPGRLPQPFGSLRCHKPRDRRHGSRRLGVVVPTQCRYRRCSARRRPEAAPAFALGPRPHAADRLVLALHVGYAFVPLGFPACRRIDPWPAAIPASAGIHAWTAGAVGLMTLAVMTRASLGHTGQRLEGGRPCNAGDLCGCARRGAHAHRPACRLQLDVVLLHIAGLGLGGGVRRVRCSSTARCSRARRA